MSSSPASERHASVALPSAGSRLAAYVALAKPRIIELLLITTIPAMVLAGRGWPGTWLVLATLIGGTASAAGANTLNSYLDRDIDEVMRRTRGRPLVQHKVPASHALIQGCLLGLAGLVILGLTSNWLAGAISTAALLFYVFVYTIALKRRSPQNIVIGGAAGGAPVLVAWAAVTGTVEPAAWALFLVVFYWTPPHFWALALRYRDDYEAAGVPMLPVVAGVEATTRRMLLYTSLVVATSLILVPLARMSWVYLIGALGLGAWFLWDTWRVHRDPSRAMSLFGTSNLYLAALFAAVMLDVLL